ncbi:MAG: sigma-70 family RNA polymerase sigma factor [Clostridium sartagoforme]|nr:sigma-70 family RNA polymerase sigma factor [Clostridium sartagoforme]
MEQNDLYLVQGIKSKDKNSLCKLMENYGKLVIYISSKILTNSYEKEFIDECYNDVFTTIWFNIECFNEEKGCFRNWLISITKYKALDIKRKNYKLNNSVEYTPNILSSEEDNFEKLENIQMINVLLQSIDEKDRNILIKKYYQGFSIKEIALELNCTEDYIYTRISRARKKLKRIVGE